VGSVRGHCPPGGVEWAWCRHSPCGMGFQPAARAGPGPRSRPRITATPRARADL